MLTYADIQVDCVDSSAPALLLAEKNAALNGVTDKLTLIKQDVAGIPC
jgi:23S rRNA G2069 N7-methylase RlmK/C1962 C5-methylase RlmI